MLENNYTGTLVRLAVEAYPLTDAELGSLISRIATMGQKQLGNIDEKIFNEEDKASVFPLFARILPEISARLMCRDGVRLAYRRMPEYSSTSESELREMFSEIFSSDQFKKLSRALAKDFAEDGQMKDINLATAQAVNGNIALIGLDRIAEPDLKNDKLASMIILTGSVRGTPCPEGVWSPKMARDQIQDITLHDCSYVLQDSLLDEPDVDDETFGEVIEDNSDMTCTA